jgi:hypothetical protein
MSGPTLLAKVGTTLKLDTTLTRAKKIKGMATSPEYLCRACNDLERECGKFKSIAAAKTLAEKKAGNRIIGGPREVAEIGSRASLDLDVGSQALHRSDSAC